MKQIKLTALRKTVLVLVAIMLVACMAVAFVACNGGDGKGEVSVSVKDINSNEFNSALNGMIGYLYANSESYDAAYIGGEYVSVIEEDEEDKVVAELSLALRNYDEHDDEAAEPAEPAEDIMVEVVFYKTEQDATAQLARYETRYDGFEVNQNGNVIVIESKEGVYAQVKGTALPKDATQKAQINFINKALKNELKDKNESVGFSVSGKLDSFYLYCRPATGNISRMYQFMTEVAYEDSDFKLKDWDAVKSQYTNDSYAKKTDDNIYYVEAQPKPGFIYEANDDETGYVIEGYYYAQDPTSLVLPSTHNNKPIVGIEYIDIPESLTEITFEGTKEQLNTIIENSYIYDLGNVTVIHCTNGDINLGQGE